MQPSQNKKLNSKIAVDLSAQLGQGSSGYVYKGISISPQPHPVAIKAIPLKEINNSVTSYLLECELEALKTLSKTQNSSIVKLEEIVVIDNHCYIAMQILEGGSLKEYISKKGKLQEEEAFKILHNILEGYKLLKIHGIVHRDLKPDNIIFKEDPHQRFSPPKIIDFGYCKAEKIKNKPKMFYNVGSPRYMSPEAYLENLYTEKSDIWSIGITFYEMVTGTTFDKGKNILETFGFIKEKGIPIPRDLNEKTKRILQSMLMYNHSKRSSCEQLLNEYFTVKSQLYHYRSPMQTQRQNISLQKMRQAPRKMMRSPTTQNLIHPPPNISMNNKQFNHKRAVFIKSSEMNRESPKKIEGVFKNALPMKINIQTLNSCSSQKNINFKVMSPLKKSPPERSSEDIEKQKQYQQKVYENSLFRVSQASSLYESPNLRTTTSKVARIITSPNIVIQNQNMIKSQNLEVSHPPNQNKNHILVTPKKINNERNELLNFSQRIIPNHMIDMEASKRNRVEDQRILNINHNKLPSRNTPPLNSPIPVFINHNVVTRRHMVPQNFVLKSK